MRNDKSQVELLEEELQLLRSGKPFHTHRYFENGEEVIERCSSPYCNSLSEPPREDPHA